MKALLSTFARSLLASHSATDQLRAFLSGGAREGVVTVDGKTYTIEFVPKARL